MDTLLKNYYSGTSGLLLPVPNKLHYPKEFQDKSRLCYYASLMNSIEINSSFYKIPQTATVRKWAAEVPTDFRFTFKLSKEITHNKDLDFNPEHVARFFEVISGVGQKKGCLLVQLPPSVRLEQFKQLDTLMSVLRSNEAALDWHVAFEFRHASLYVEEVYELLESYQLGLVLHDKLPTGLFINSFAPNFVYLRFHGPDGNYRGSYTADALHEYATYIKEWIDERKEVFVYFNNTMGQVHANLKLLSDIVHQH